MATYNVKIAIGCTGGGFAFSTNDLEEVEEYVNEYKDDRINQIKVWDSKTSQFVYWKEAFEFDPLIDMFSDIHRDFRFKNRLNIKG